MPRIGWNPARGKETDYRPARVTLAMLTYVPALSGYFEQRFQALKLSLESLIAHTPEPHDLLVFDNGSSREVTDYLCQLREKGLIDYLLLSSRNVGKIGALQFIANTAPGEIIAYSDDDIYFKPGWLSQHLQVIDTYPQVGAVTGFYIRTRARDANEATHRFIDQNAEVTREQGLLIPRAWEEEYIDNSNRTWEQYAQEVQGLEDVRITYRGLQTWVSAHHFQFVAPKEVVQEALPATWSGKLMGQMMEFDQAIDKQGKLRLCTGEQTVNLLGGALDEKMLAWGRQLGLDLKAADLSARKGLGKKLVKIPLLNGMANRLYHYLYKILFS